MIGIRHSIVHRSRLVRLNEFEATIKNLDSSIRILPDKGLDVCKWGTQHLRKNDVDRPMGGQGGLLPDRWMQPRPIGATYLAV